MTDPVDTEPGGHVAVSRGDPADPDARRRNLSLVGAALVVVLVFAAVLVFGVARPPELSHVSEASTGLAAGVAWTAWDESSTCVNVADPDGTVRELYCDEQGGDVMSWTAEGILLRSWTSAGELELVIDSTDGSVVSRRTVEDTATLPDTEYVRSSREDGRLVVSLELSGDVIWDVESPEAYRIEQGQRSPDGDWVAMSDSAQRLLVVPADGSTDPLVWVADFDTWQMVVWQDTRAAMG